MAFATDQDVQQFVDGDLDTVLDYVESIIRSRIPDLDQRVAASDQYRRIVIAVESSAAARVMRNPEGMLQESEMSYSYSRSARAAGGYLMITPEEWAWLGVGAGPSTVRPDVGTRRQLPAWAGSRTDTWGWQSG